MSENHADLGSEATNNNPDFAAQTPQPGEEAGPTAYSHGHASVPPSPWSAAAAAQPTPPSAPTPSVPSAAQPTPSSAPTPSVPYGAQWTQDIPIPGPIGFPGPIAPRQESRAGRRVATIVAAAAIALGAGGVGGFVGYALHNNTGSGPLQSFSSNNNVNPAPVIDRSSLASIAASVQPAVVDIKTQEGEGSGVVISSDGYIVTNNHVVAGAQGNTVQVGFNSGRQVTARIVGADPQTDLAVVKADATGLSHLDWANSDGVRVGDTVLAIGSPLGLQGSVTAGIVSALHRTIQASDQQSPFSRSQSSTTIGDAIQTDAAINPGNSGGALVNTEGKIIGINTAIATGGSGSNGNIGVGFAISSNKAKSATDQLISKGKVSHPFLGVSVSDASTGGALIGNVQSGSAADKAGIKQGDVVTKVNDRTISNGNDLVGAIQAATVGSQVQLTIVRNGQQMTVTATVGEGQ